MYVCISILLSVVFIVSLGHFYITLVLASYGFFTLVIPKLFPKKIFSFVN